MSESRKYREVHRWSRSSRSFWRACAATGRSGEVCREHQISETQYYGWRDQLLQAGAERFAGKEERVGESELRKKIAELERVLGRKTYELEIAGKLLRDWE